MTYRHSRFARTHGGLAERPLAPEGPGNRLEVGFGTLGLGRHIGRRASDLQTCAWS